MINLNNNLTVIINLFFYIIFCVKTDLVLESKIKNKRTKYITYAIFFIINGIIIILIKNLNTEILENVFVIIMYFVFIFIFYKNSKTEKILLYLISLNTVFIVGVTIVYLAVIFIFKTALYNFFFKNTFLLDGIIDILIIALDSIILSYWNKNYFIYIIRNRKTKKYIIGILIVSFLALFLFVVLNKSFNVNGNFIFGLGYFITIFIIEGIIFYIVKIKSKYNESLMKKDILEVEVNAIKNENKRLEKINRDKNIIWHDIKNHNSVLKYLIMQKDIEKASIYLNELETNFISIEEEKITDNLILNALANIKIEQCKKDNINYFFNIVLPKKINIDSYTIAVIFGNILDNAIENCNRIEGKEKILKVNSYIQRGSLIFIVENSSTILGDLNKNDLKTSKKDKKNHGIGIESVKKAVNKYNGEIIFSNKNYMFKTTVYIPLENKSKLID